MADETVVQAVDATATPMHAHRCMACHSKGKNTVWIHSDNDAGDVQKHTCPECGQVQWRKWMVEIGQLPRHAQAKIGKNINEILNYIVLAVGVAAICYLAFIYVRAWKTEGPKGTKVL